MWAPWVGSWFPGMTPDKMVDLHLHQFVDMDAFVVKSIREMSR